MNIIIQQFNPLIYKVEYNDSNIIIIFLPEVKIRIFNEYYVPCIPKIILENFDKNKIFEFLNTHIDLLKTAHKDIGKIDVNREIIY